MVINLIEKIKSNPFLRDTVTTTGWNCLGKSVSLLIPFFIAAWFGSTGQTDAFFFCYAWIIGLSLALESVIVPFISQIRARGEDVGGFVGRILFRGNLGLILVTPTFILLLSLALPLITKFSPEDLKTTRILLLLIAPFVILITNACILAGTLNAHKRFALPAFSPAFRGLVAIAFILIFHKSLGIYSVAVGYVLGESVRLFVLLIALHRAKIKLDRKRARHTNDFFPTAGRQIIAIIAVSFIPIVDKTMASWLTPGSISNLSYAERLYQIPIAFLSGGFLVTLLSYWSRRVYGEKERQDLKKSLAKTMKIIAGGSCGLVLILVALREIIIRIAFGYSSLEAHNIRSISLLYLILIFTIIPEMISLVLTRVCLIYKRTDIMRNLGILRLILKIGFNLLMMHFWGIYGIAVSTVITVSISLIYLWRRVAKIQ